MRFRLAYRYRVVHEIEPAPYHIQAFFYSYSIHDRNDDELLAFQWAPEGISPVYFPHLHISAVPSIIVPLRAGPMERTSKLNLSKIHIPTGHILLEDVVELLITEFGVEPRRADWQDVLDANRAAVSAG